MAKAKNHLETVLAVEEGESAPEEYYRDLQRLINDGEAWCYQGSMGRAMMAAIAGGFCCLGRKAARDFYGNYIPSRDEVQEGSKGSLRFVREAQGESWARMIDEVE